MLVLFFVFFSNDFDYLGHKTGACKDLLSTSYTGAESRATKRESKTLCRLW